MMRFLGLGAEDFAGDFAEDFGPVAPFLTGMGITIGLTVAFLVVVLRGPAFGLGGGVKGTPFLAGVFGGVSLRVQCKRD